MKEKTWCAVACYLWLVDAVSFEDACVAVCIRILGKRAKVFGFTRACVCIIICCA